MILKNLFKNLVSKKKNNAIKKFQDKSDLLITYAELKNIPINTLIQIKPSKKGAIECIRINSNNNNSLMFTVTMKKGELWEKHHHDCDEVCIVYRGKLKDLLTSKTANAAQILFAKAYESHYVLAEEDSVFYVEFKNPKQL